MQILYVLAIGTIFTLCLALFSVARRILRASPLQSGDLSLSGINERRGSADTYARKDENDEDMDLPDFSLVHAVIGPIPEPTPEPMPAPALKETVVEELPTNPLSAQPAVEQRVAPTVAEQPVSKKSSTREPANSRAISSRNSVDSGYTLLLKGFLIGMSAVALIQTQRSRSRARVQTSSRRRVA